MALTKNAGILVGLALNPETDVQTIMPFVDQLDYVLIMSVHPGFGGQSFIPEVLDKVRFLRENFPDLEIQIDGGINAETSKEAVQAGVTNLVAGSFIFGAEDRETQISFLNSGG